MKTRSWLVLLLVSLFGESCARGPVTGGFSEVPVEEASVVAAAQFAVSDTAAPAREPAPGAAGRLSLVKILRAEQQVVAGTNFRLRLLVAVPGQSERTAEAVVWWQPWRRDPHRLTSWEWR